METFTEITWLSCIGDVFDACAIQGSLVTSQQDLLEASPIDQNRTYTMYPSQQDAIQGSLVPSQPYLHGFQETAMPVFMPCIRSGVWYDRGHRQSMEDEHVLVDNLEDYLGSQFVGIGSGSFFGVFDGHEGRSAAEFVRDNLLKFIVEDVAFPSAVEEAVHNAFLRTDAAFAEACAMNQDLYSGTTALTVLVLGREIFVANAGDCRAVLCRKGEAMEMSRDHKPNAERNRIEALGGFVIDGYLNGELSVARALGNWHIDGLKGANGPLIADPEVRHTSLTEDDEFMIIGCDGFWDVFTSENAVTFARRKLQQHNDPRECSHELVDEALHRDSSDNLTVVTVCFQTSPPRQTSPPTAYRPRFMARRQLYTDSSRCIR